MSINNLSSTRPRPSFFHRITPLLGYFISFVRRTRARALDALVNKNRREAGDTSLIKLWTMKTVLGHLLVRVLSGE